MQEPDEITLELAELSLAAKRWRAEAAPAACPRVLAVHGWLDNASSFDRVATGLGAAEVVALDLPGHGRSDHRSEGPYHFIDQVADVVAAADALGWPRFALVGHSLGASIGAVIAGTFPARIERLVMIESLGPLTETVEGTPARLARALVSEREARPRRKRVYPEPSAAAHELALATGMHESSARILVERGLAPVADGWLWRADPRLRRPSRLRLGEEQVHAFLAAIACPILLVTGSEGHPRDDPRMRTRFERLAGRADFEHRDFAGGHHVHLDNADEVGPCLRRFLAGERGEGSP